MAADTVEEEEEIEEEGEVSAVALEEAEVSTCLFYYLIMHG